jgi:hypothetical protein
MRCVDRLSRQPQLDVRLQLVDSNLNSPLGHPFGILRHRVNASTLQRFSRLFDRPVTTASSRTKGSPTSLLQDFTLAAGPRPPHAPIWRGARSCFARWRKLGKVQQLGQRYPWLRDTPVPASPQRHRRFSLGFRVGFVDRRPAKNLKETAVVRSAAVGLDPIPLGNNGARGQQPRQMIRLRSSSASRTCCSRSQADRTSFWGTSALAGCR